VPKVAVTSTTAPVAPSKHEPVSCITEAAGPADASTHQVVPKVAPASMPVTKVASTTESSDVMKFIQEMTEAHSKEIGAILYKQRPMKQCALFEPWVDDEDRMRRQAESDERWMQQVRSQSETPTAATLDANKAATTTTIDTGAHPKVTMKDDDIMNDEDEAEMIIRTLGIYGVETGPRLRNGNTTINTKTTPCITNNPCGSRHNVIPRRLHDAFVIKVGFFRDLLSVALGTTN
jgi:hypothetical protein